ncbi:MAG: glycosyltransferase family 1 protein [Rhodospirillales bacterium]|nr:glycosyltransferase family 1 protein [Rhodospirillales bacterium]MCB9980143.1 glycosyltransferase family 1 protein [Rhodospirillales bacterium]
MRIAQFNVDPVFRPHNVAQILSKAAAVDATFITTAGPALSRFHTDHGIVAYIPNPVDPSMESLRCHEHTDQPHSVFWAHRYGKAKHQDATSPRTQYPLFLERAGVDIDYYGMNGKPELYGQVYFQAIAQAKMGLNLSITKAGPDAPEASEEELFLYASDRISHYMGCGLLTLTTNKNHLEDLFTPDEEIIIFETVEELLEKVRFYSQNDTARQRIAAAGWQKSHTEFNSTLISRYMVEQTFRAPLSATYQWPTEVY